MKTLRQSLGRWISGDPQKRKESEANKILRQGFAWLSAFDLSWEVEARLDEIGRGPRNEFNAARKQLLYDAMIEYLKRMPKRCDTDEIFQDIISVVFDAEYGASNITDEMRAKYGRGEW